MTTVAFHHPLQRTLENIAEQKARFENQTGMDSHPALLFVAPGGVDASGTIWGFFNDNATLFFVNP